MAGLTSDGETVSPNRVVTLNSTLPNSRSSRFPERCDSCRPTRMCSIRFLVCPIPAKVKNLTRTLAAANEDGRSNSTSLRSIPGETRNSVQLWWDVASAVYFRVRMKASTLTLPKLGCVWDNSRPPQVDG